MKAPSPAWIKRWRLLNRLRVNHSKNFLLLTVSFLALPAFLWAQNPQKGWEFPWGEGFVPLKVEIEESPVDGHIALSELWKSSKLLIGGPASGQWIAETGRDESLRLRLRYSTEMHCSVYLYPPGIYIPSNIGGEFEAFAEKIAKDAKSRKGSKVVFEKNEEGGIKVHPDLIVNKRSIFYDPNQEKPQGDIPLILGQPFYELRYSYVQSKKPVSGSAIFVYLTEGIFCVNFETTSERFEARYDLLREYLASLYVAASTQQSGE